MCLTVYVGSDHPLEPDKTPVPNGSIVLAMADRCPAALAQKAHVGMIVTWVDGRTGCSCGFHDQSLPWDPQDEEAETIAAFDRLRAHVKAQIADGETPLVFGCWTDCADDPPGLVWQVDPDLLRAGFGLFQGGHIMRGGMPPQTYLIRITPGIAEPQGTPANVQ